MPYGGRSWELGAGARTTAHYASITSKRMLLPISRYCCTTSPPSSHVATGDFGTWAMSSRVVTSCLRSLHTHGNFPAASCTRRACFVPRPVRTFEQAGFEPLSHALAIAGARPRVGPSRSPSDRRRPIQSQPTPQGTTDTSTLTCFHLWRGPSVSSTESLLHVPTLAFCPLQNLVVNDVERVDVVDHAQGSYPPPPFPPTYHPF